MLTIDAFTGGLVALAAAVALALWLVVPRRRWPPGWKGSEPVLPADHVRPFKSWGDALHMPDPRAGRRS